MSTVSDRHFQDFALRLAPAAAAVANYCDHVEHNEIADRAWVLGVGADLRQLAWELAVGAFAEPREREELLRRRLPDVLLFGVKLWTVMGSRLPDEVFPDLTAPRRLGPQSASAR